MSEFEKFQAENRLRRPRLSAFIVALLFDDDYANKIIKAKEEKAKESEMIACARCAQYFKRSETRPLHDGRLYCSHCYQNETNIFKAVATPGSIYAEDGTGKSHHG